MNYVNLTPHAIVLNDGRSFAPSGQVARVSVTFGEIKDDLAEQLFGDVENLPAPVEGTRFIVSALVKSATNRPDVVAPATGHPEVRRSEKGFILSVPCFV